MNPSEWNLPPFFDDTVFGNTVLEWSIAAVVFAVTLFALPLAVRFVAKRLRTLTLHSRTRWDDIVVQAIQRTRGFFYLLLAVWFSSLVLEIPERGRDLLRMATIVGVLTQAGLWLAYVVRTGIHSVAEQRVEKDPASATGMTAINMLAQMLVWVAVVLVALDNLGVDVTAFVAGLGVAGIAIGLAVQNVLGDLFASISIVLDKPFVIGDFIVTGDHSGTVEKVGLKTTRVRSISGEELVFSNKDLLDSRLRNYKRMQERRAVFEFGLLYATPLETVRRIPDELRAIIESQENTRFDRAHFKGFGDSSLDFEVVFHMLVPDYAVYMDAQQAINLQMMERFEALGVDFAFPTRTLHVYAGDGQGAEDAFPTRVLGTGSDGRERPMDAA